MIKKILIITVFLTYFNSAVAGTAVNRTVEAVGCYGVNSHCFAILSGAIFGPTACRSTQVRWSSTATNGKELLATFMLAQSSDKKVSVAFSDSQCFGQYPSLSWAYSDN